MPRNNNASRCNIAPIPLALIPKVAPSHIINHGRLLLPNDPDRWKRCVHSSQLPSPPTSQKRRTNFPRNPAFNHSQSGEAEAEYDRLRDLARQEAGKRSSCFDRVETPPCLTLECCTLKLISRTGASSIRARRWGCSASVVG